MGEKEQAILKQCFALHQPIPDRIRNAPSLRLGLSLYWWAFWELTTERPGGWGVMPIPWSSIKDFADANEFDDDLRHSLFHHVRGMDKAYREHYEKQNKK